MHHRLALAACLAASLVAGAAAGADRDPGSPAPAMKREIIPGSELMTSAERERYRQRMSKAGSPQEQARVRDDHVKRMQERARLRGLRLADPNAATTGK